MLELQHQGPFRAIRPVILASGSPRRQYLLTQLGIDFQVRVSSFKEPPAAEGQDPVEYALTNAQAKAEDVAANLQGPVVISADTIVVQGKNILGKPRGEQEAQSMLLSLSGSTHEVITACCILDTMNMTMNCCSVNTRVTMVESRHDILEAYVRTGEPMDKAGAYAIQGCGGFLVSEISGSYSNVVGLPLSETVQGLRSCRAIDCSGESA